jgi:hypothetical protein
MNELRRVGRWMRIHPKLTLSISIVLVGPLLGAALQDALFMDLVGGIEGIAILTPITLLLGLVALVSFLARRSVGNILRYSLVVGLALILSLVCFLETAHLINYWKVNAVESYVLRAASILDRIKAETHAYPEELPIDIIGEPPSLLSDYGTYTATKDAFCFEYIDEPAGWAGGEGFLKFDSSTRKWVEER